eukprot:7460686-Alexandrium_andersonii.AAC.1
MTRRHQHQCMVLRTTYRTARHSSQPPHALGSRTGRRSARGCRRSRRPRGRCPEGVGVAVARRPPAAPPSHARRATAAVRRRA